VPAKPRANDRADRLQRRGAARRLRLAYRMGAADRQMEVDPWAVVLRHSRWYPLCWSHAKQERRVLRVDRIVAIEILPATFTPPDDLDALRVLEEHLSQGWTYPVDVLVYATVEEAATWLPRSLARLEPDGDRTRLRATTDDPDWNARQLARIPAPFAVLGSAELRRATSALSGRLLRAAGARADDGAAPDQRNAGGTSSAFAMPAPDSANRAG
jgi:predicted DNA-binding transcriptional regulator YafY